jgi:transcriptional regulator with XRE-family HTH domain
MPDNDPAPRSVRAVINPRLLEWARTTIGLSVEDAARKIGVRPSRLSEWEDGRLSPRVTQLRNAANVYKRPLAILFLPAPPETPQTPHDFRRLPDQEAQHLSPELLLEMRRARRRRAVAMELFSESDRQVVALPLRAALGEDPEIVGSRARTWLGVTQAQQGEWGGPNPGDALNGWIAVFESRVPRVSDDRCRTGRDARVLPQ